MSSSSSFFVLLLLLLLFCINIKLLFISAAASTQNVDFTDCDNCIQVVIYRDAFNRGYSSNCADLPMRNGKRAFKAIIRSAKLEGYIKAVLPKTGSTIIAYYYDGTDAADEGTWIIPSTGEILYTAGSTYQFAYINFADVEPNGVGGENLLAYYLSVQIPASNNYYRVVDISAPSLWMYDANSAILCMYQYDVITSVAVTQADAQSGAYNLLLGSEFVRYQLFPEHVTWSAAQSKCESMIVADPNTGQLTTGHLATFYPTSEWRLVKDMISSKSDIPYHSSDGAFGAWVGYTSRVGSTDTWMLQEGSTTVEQIRTVNNDNCVAQIFCNIGTTPANNQRVALGTGKNYKFIWNPNSYTMPYVCMWRFIVNASIKAPSSYSKDFTDATSVKIVPNVTVVTIRYYGVWNRTEDSIDHCWKQKLTNEVGDTVRGTLGTFFKTSEWALATNLSHASQFMSDADPSYLGVAVGLSSTPSYTWGTNTTDLKQRLLWNRDGFVSVGNDDTSDDVFPWSVPAYDSAGASCSGGIVCASGGITVVDDTDQVAMTFRDDTQTLVTMTYNRRRSYFCTFRFPIRRQIHPQIVAEYHSTPMKWGNAKKFCSLRQITGPGGVLVNGTNFITRVRFGSDLLVKQVADFVTNGTIPEGPVWVGDRNVNNNKCLFWRRRYKYFEWTSCNSVVAFDFVCYFELHSTFTSTKTGTSDVSVTATKSLQSLTKTLTKSKSISETISSENSESLSPSNSISSEKSSSISESSSASRSVSLTSDQSASFSQTPSTSSSISSAISQSVSIHSPSSTPSKSDTKTADPTQSFSSSDSLSSDVSASATGNTASLSPGSTFSHEITSSASKSAPSFGAAETHSSSPSDHTETKTIHIVSKYVLPEEIKNLQQVTGLATLLSSGGSVAVTQARLEAVDTLSKCGQAHVLEDEDPGFMSSPTRWQFGDPDPPTTYAKGGAVGNVVAAVGCAFALCALAIIFGLVFKRSWRVGVDMARVPGITLTPFLIFVPASSQFTAVLLFNDPSPFGRLAALGSGFIMIGITMAVVVQLGRLVGSGLLTLRSLPRHEPSKITNWLNGRHWGRKITKVVGYCFTAELCWTPYVDVTEYLDVVSGKEDSSKRRQSERAGKFCIAWGAVFEDFNLPFFTTLDVACSVVLGFCAGVALTPNLPRLQCIITLSAAVIAAATHFFVLLYFRPCLVRATQWFLSVASGLTFLSMILSFTYFLGQSFAYNTVMEKVMLAQAILGVFTMVVGVCSTAMLLIDFVDAFVAGKELRHMDQSTQEKLLKYKTELLQRQNARHNNNNINMRGNDDDDANDHHRQEKAKRKTLASEFAVLLEEMKPIHPDDKKNKNNNNISDRQSVSPTTTTTTTRRINIYNAEDEEEEMDFASSNTIMNDDENDDDEKDRMLVDELLLMSPKTSSKRKTTTTANRLPTRGPNAQPGSYFYQTALDDDEENDEDAYRGFKSYEDYLFESSSDDDDGNQDNEAAGEGTRKKILSAKQRRRLREKKLQQEKEEEANKFFVPLSPLEQAAKKKNLRQEQLRAAKSGNSTTYVSQRERQRIAEHIVQAQAIIRSSLDDAEQLQRQHQKSTGETPLLPQFHNSAVTSTQAKQLQNILAKADQDKRRNEEEKYKRILQQQEEKEKQQQELERQRKLRRDIQNAQEQEKLIAQQLQDEKIRQQRLRNVQRSQTENGHLENDGEDDDEFNFGDDDDDEENLREIDDILGKI